MWNNKKYVYLFGGYGFDNFGSIGYLNDLWKFELLLNEWTRLSGSQTINQVSTEFYPGGRSGFINWNNNNQNLLMFGGTYGQYSSELWIFDTEVNTWQLIDGYPDSYLLKLPSSLLNPGSRTSDTQNNHGVFIGDFGYLNLNPIQIHDMWKFECDFNITIRKETFCYNISSFDQLVCSGNGICIDIDTCHCADGYYGEMCQSFNQSDLCNKTREVICYEISSFDPDVCSGNGICIDIDTCHCADGYYGEMCQFLNHSKICNQTDCDETFCYNISSFDILVCSGNGICIGTNNCHCSNGYYG